MTWKEGSGKIRRVSRRNMGKKEDVNCIWTISKMLISGLTWYLLVSRWELRETTGLNEPVGSHQVDF